MFIKLGIIIICITFSNKPLCQILWDTQWYFDGRPNSERVDFRTSNLSTSIENVILDMNRASVISDDKGDLVLYSDGCEVRNSNYSIIENGGNLNPGLSDFGYCPGGTPLQQGSILIPKPEANDEYLLFLLDLDWVYLMDTNFIGLAPSRIYLNEIDISENNGLGKVEVKNEIVLYDTLGRCCINGIKHGNGRDWYLVAPKSHSNCYFILNVTPNSVIVIDTICEGKIWGDLDLLGQSVFSPNGEFYARSDIAQGVHLFRFDRCSGKLGYMEELISGSDISGGAGVAFSPNSRFLYSSYGTKLYQFDLLHSNIGQSKILIGDRTDDLPQDIKDFYQMQLNPNGKIYCGSSGSFDRLHVIHNPNHIGDSCNLEMGGLKLMVNNYFSIPQFPHFRLGPLDGSICDSLLIDNDPTAYFQNEALPGSQNLTLKFKNLSYGDVETFVWDFGDGQTSELFEPEHSFQNYGSYHVCLTAQNTNKEHSYCSNVNLQLSSLPSIESLQNIRLFPNPVKRVFTVTFDKIFTKPIQIKIISLTGILLDEITTCNNKQEIDVNHLSSGIYFVLISSKDDIPVIQKLIINH